MAARRARRSSARPRRRSCWTSVDAGVASPTIYRHGGGNPFYLEQLARASGAGRLPRARRAGNGAAGAGVPAAVAARAGRGARVAVAAGSRALLDAAAVAGEPFEPDLAAAVAELSGGGGARGARRPARRSTSCARPRCRGASSSATRSCAARSTSRRRGGWRLAAHARAAAALAARGAAAAERAHHVEQSAGQGDEEAIAVLLEAGAATAAARARRAAARWFEAALRLLPAGDAERQVDVRVALASALRSLGELERCRATLLEAIELLPADDGRAAGRADRAVRGRRALAGAPRGGPPAPRRAPGRSCPTGHDAARPRRCRSSWPSTGSTSSTSSRRSRWGAARWTPRAALGDRALIAAAASALALGEAAAGRDRRRARAPRRGAASRSTGSSDAELAPRLEALYYLGWAENYLEHYDEAIAHVERGIAIARATGEGRLLVPLMLVKGYPFEMQGRLAEAIELCEAAVEVARGCRPTRTTCSGRCSSSAGRTTTSGDLDAAIDGVRGERARGRPAGGRHDAGRPAAGRAGRWRAPASSAASWTAASR